ncbi:MAG TPA: hypothetical protein VFV94_15105 [Polyangiaceae bacterium]|nr:hypothetical protein [Polyangiaceae bacterium]
MNWLNVAGFSCAVGCAPVGLGPPKTLDAPLSQRTGEVPYGLGTVAKLEQQGPLVKVSAYRRCKLVEQTVMRRTVTRERVNLAPELDWALGATGAALAVGGVVVLVDSGSVYESNIDSRTYNPVGPSNARVIGGTLVAAGLGLAAIALVDQARASGFQQHTEAVAVDGKTLDDRISCSQSVIAEADVALAFRAGEPSFVGRTGKNGVLTFEPDAFVPQALELGPDGKLTILVDEAPVGEISTAALYAQREARAYAALDAKLCTEPARVDACAGWQAFLTRYPAGVHAAAVRDVLVAAEPGLVALRDKAAWATVEQQIPICKAQKTLVTLDAACKSLRDYQATYPSGVGREPVSKALASIAQKRLALEKKKVRCTAACLQACERGPDPAACAATCDTKCTE